MLRETKLNRLDLTPCVCDTHLNNKLVKMPVVSNLENLYTFFSTPRHFVNIWKEEEKTKCIEWKPNDFWWFLSYNLSIRSIFATAAYTLELFSSRSLHGDGGNEDDDVLFVVVWILLFFRCRALSPWDSLCFRCLSARRCDMQFGI